MIENPNKAYVDFYLKTIEIYVTYQQFKNEQDNEFDITKLTHLDSISVNREPRSDNQLANRNFIDDQLDKVTILSFFSNARKIIRVLCWK